MNKKMFKKSPEEIQEWLKFKKHGSVKPAKRGKGSYKRIKKGEIE